MIHFEWPWLLAALPLPLLIRWLVPARMPVEQAALKVSFPDLVPTRYVGMNQGRATSCNAGCLLLLHAAQRADTAFPRSAWERERI